MKISIEDITAVELLAVAKVLNNITDKVVTPSDAPVVVTTDDVAGVAEEEVVNEPSDNTIDFDKEGLPWDERIHSSNHKLTGQGVWMRRRGVTDIKFDRVKAELLAKWQAGEPIVETPVQPVAPVAPVVAPAFVPVQQPQAPVAAPVAAPVIDPAPVQPVAPVAPVAPVVAPAPAQASLYDTLMGKLKTALANKLVEANYMQGLLNTVNATFGANYQGMFELRDNDAAMQYVINELAKKGI